MNIEGLGPFVVIEDDEEAHEIVALTEPAPDSLTIDVPKYIATLHLQYSPALECSGKWSLEAYLEQVQRFVPEKTIFRFTGTPDVDAAIRILYCNQHVSCAEDTLIANSEVLGRVESRVEGCVVTLSKLKT